ncbi:hypothetical protein XELAEV_18020068mg [Xenopus laevis]|uniref:Uncharacterized protein n=1 Tax=Xenopus laevis TaxID=8355 RepID=A0A974HQP0_XENLA|nr:hypothetical protein XELAEV_18020068mg [Xenopus laevis]
MIMPKLLYLFQMIPIKVPQQFFQKVNSLFSNSCGYQQNPQQIKLVGNPDFPPSWERGQLERWASIEGRPAKLKKLHQNGGAGPIFQNSKKKWGNHQKNYWDYTQVNNYLKTIGTDKLTRSLTEWELLLQQQISHPIAKFYKKLIGESQKEEIGYKKHWEKETNIGFTDKTWENIMYSAHKYQVPLLH